MREWEFKGFDKKKFFAQREEISLRELFDSDDYRAWVFKGASNLAELGEVKALRLVGKQVGFFSALLYFEGFGDGRAQRAINSTIRKETKALRVHPMIAKFERLGIDVLRRRELQTLGALVIEKNIATQKDIIEIIFPKVFMNLDPNLPPSQREYFGAAVATHFLKKIPFKV